MNRKTLTANQNMCGVDPNIVISYCFSLYCWCERALLL